MNDYTFVHGPYCLQTVYTSCTGLLHIEVNLFHLILKPLNS